jgi:hypothetical protein
VCEENKTKRKAVAEFSEELKTVIGPDQRHGEQPMEESCCRLLRVFVAPNPLHLPCFFIFAPHVPGTTKRFWCKGELKGDSLRLTAAAAAASLFFSPLNKFSGLLAPR